MSTYLCFWMCVVTVTTVVMVPTEGEIQNGREISYPEKPTWPRKRGIISFTDHLAAIPSANALRKFMNSVTEIISYRNLYRQYEKPGTYEDAVKDFESLLPKNVKELVLPGGVEGKMGSVTDRTVLIRSNSELGKPMMTIRHRDQKLDRIVYTD